jgi:hypothetical protein
MAQSRFYGMNRTDTEAALRQTGLKGYALELLLEETAGERQAIRVKALKSAVTQNENSTIGAQAVIWLACVAEIIGNGAGGSEKTHLPVFQDVACEHILFRGEGAAYNAAILETMAEAHRAIGLDSVVEPDQGWVFAAVRLFDMRYENPEMALFDAFHVIPPQWRYNIAVMALRAILLNDNPHRLPFGGTPKEWEVVLELSLADMSTGEYQSYDPAGWIAC